MRVGVLRQNVALTPGTTVAVLEGGSENETVTVWAGSSDYKLYVAPITRAVHLSICLPVYSFALIANTLFTVHLWVESQCARDCACIVDARAVCCRVLLLCRYALDIADGHIKFSFRTQGAFSWHGSSRPRLCSCAARKTLYSTRCTGSLAVWATVSWSHLSWAWT